MAKAERNYKDNLFRMIFREKKELLGLYNALNGTNYDNPEELLEQCKTLKDYTCYVEKVRKYAGEMNIEDAVNKAVNECIEESILREFLIHQKAEVVSMSILEYDEEKELIKIRRAEYELGVADGIEQGMERGLAEGIKRGIAMGMEQNIRLIRKKFEKNMDAASIADILELEAAYVEHVIGLIKDNTNASDLEIAEKIRV